MSAIQTKRAKVAHARHNRCNRGARRNAKRTLQLIALADLSNSPIMADHQADFSKAFRIVLHGAAAVPA